MVRRTVLSVLVLVLGSCPGVAQSCGNCQPPPTYQRWWAPGTVLGVYIDPTFTSDEQNLAQQAVIQWMSQPSAANNNYSSEWLTDDPGTQTPNTIRIINDVNDVLTGNALSRTQSFYLDNSTRVYAATIAFWADYHLGPTVLAYDPSSPNADAFFQKTIEHELGHVFGLLDSHMTYTTSGCNLIVGDSIMNGYCGTNDSGVGGNGTMGSGITSCDDGVVAWTINQGVRTSGKQIIGFTNQDAGKLLGDYRMREGCGSFTYDVSSQSGPLQN
jgi:hypothetical protein